MAASDEPDPALIAAMTAAPSTASDSSTPAAPDNNVPTPETVNSVVSSDGPSPEMIAAMQGAQHPAQTPKTLPSSAPVHVSPAAAPSRFVQAGSPQPTSTKGSPPELSWGQTLEQAGHNLLPSAGQAAGSIWNAVTHPGQTLQALGQVATGAGSQLAGTVGVQQDPAQKAKNEALVKALEQHYTNVYGSVKGFKQGLATDPTGVLMDASMIADPAAGVLGKVGEAGKLGALSDAAGAASKVLPYVNPVHSALALARVPGKALSAVGRGVGSVTSGVPLSALKIATQIGHDSDPVAQAAFTRFATGQGDATEIQQAGQKALAGIKQAASNQYLEGKSQLLNEPVPLSGTYDALDKAEQELGMGATSGFPDAKKAIAAARGLADEFANKTDPADQNVAQADALKKQMWDLKNQFSNPTAQQYLGQIYNGVKSDISAVDPNYAKLMETYQEGLGNINDLTKTLGLGNKAAATTALTKQLRMLKTGTGSNLLQQIFDTAPELRGALAGAAVQPWSRGINSLWEGLAGGSLGTLLAHPAGAMAAVPGMAAGWAASSPRIVGSSANLLGKLSGAFDSVGNPIGQAITKGAYYGSRPNDIQSASPAAPTAPVSTPTADPVFNKMLHIESGNQQFRKNGQPVISPKGAVGAAQVLPETGPQAAALAGETWDPTRLATDQDYNTKLGYAYYKHLADQFGDPVLGAAAYNAGPSALQKALQEAHSTGSNWLDHLPAETQNYVRYVSEPKASATGGRIERASGGAALSHEQLVDRLMRRAEQAKKAADASTKPLLNVPDNTVVKALDLAQRSI